MSCDLNACPLSGPRYACSNFLPIECMSTHSIGIPPWCMATHNLLTEKCPVVGYGLELFHEEVVCSIGHPSNMVWCNHLSNCTSIAAYTKSLKGPMLLPYSTWDFCHLFNFCFLQSCEVFMMHVLLCIGQD
jgi:hypothetical protein